MSNQASEDELLRLTMYSVLYPEAQEPLDNLVNGLACHYERLGKSIATAHAADKYTLEYVYDQLRSLIRTEKLKLLAEVRERVVGEDDKAGRLSITLTVGRNQLRDTQRAALTAIEGELL